MAATRIWDADEATARYQPSAISRQLSALSINGQAIDVQMN
jgi:hypothetical protein